MRPHLGPTSAHVGPAGTGQGAAGGGILHGMPFVIGDV
jgi:hypothetical protein